MKNQTILKPVTERDCGDAMVSFGGAATVPVFDRSYDPSADCKKEERRSQDKKYPRTKTRQNSKNGC